MHTRRPIWPALLFLLVALGRLCSSSSIWPVWLLRSRRRGSLAVHPSNGAPGTAIMRPPAAWCVLRSTRRSERMAVVAHGRRPAGARPHWNGPGDVLHQYPWHGGPCLPVAQTATAPGKSWLPLRAGLGSAAATSMGSAAGPIACGPKPDTAKPTSVRASTSTARRWAVHAYAWHGRVTSSSEPRVKWR
jgi:hypothetical protein